MEIAVERVGNQVSLLRCIGSIWARSSCFLPGRFANFASPSKDACSRRLNGDGSGVKAQGQGLNAELRTR